MNRRDENMYMHGYMDAFADMRRWRRKKRCGNKKEKARRHYFWKQRLYGAILLLCTLFAVKIFQEDAAIALITIPLGIALIFTKQMVLINRYYCDVNADYGS